ncbi:MAG: hypothetical protein RLW61_04620 [Gammaproteobacteria bacterium]
MNLIPKPTIVVDFDGVLHSYVSGWQGPRIITDPPVPGAMEFLVTALEHFTVAIQSSRSHAFGGRRAMKQWLKQELVKCAGSGPESTPHWFCERIMQTAFCDPWDYEVEYASKRIIEEIRWPLFKPPAIFYIDDRAMRFEGRWPSAEEIAAFRPWKVARGARL